MTVKLRGVYHERQRNVNKASKVAKQMSGAAFVKAILMRAPDLKARGERQKYTRVSGDGQFLARRHHPGKEFQGRRSPRAGRLPALRLLTLSTRHRAAGRDLLNFLNGKGLPVPERYLPPAKTSCFGMSMLEGDVLTRYDVGHCSPDDKRKSQTGEEFYVSPFRGAVPWLTQGLNLDVSPAGGRFDEDAL